MYKIFVVLSVLVVLVSSKPDGDKFTTKYDDLNLDEILPNRKIFNGYFNCIMDKGPCTPDGKELRDAIEDALKNKCAKCSDKQKEGTKKVLHFIVENKPEEWKELKAKYDPEGKYVVEYEGFAKEENLKL